MSEPTAQVKYSPEYQLGFADGGARKWKYIREMWGGLGLFIVIILIFVAPGMYDTYNDHQIKQSKVQACSHATDVTACIAAVGK